MRNTVARILLLALSVNISNAASQEPASAPVVELSAYGTRIKGERELAVEMQGRAPTQQRDAFEAARHRLSPGQSVQLKVELLDGQGGRQDITSDARVRYESLGCLTIGQGGLLTATPSGLCNIAKLPELYVIVLDDNKNTLGWNRFFFRVE